MLLLHDHRAEYTAAEKRGETENSRESRIAQYLRKSMKEAVELPKILETAIEMWAAPRRRLWNHRGHLAGIPLQRCQRLVRPRQLSTHSIFFLTFSFYSLTLTSTLVGG